MNGNGLVGCVSSVGELLDWKIKGNSWWVIPKYLTGKIPSLKPDKLITVQLDVILLLNSLFQRLGNTTEEDLTFLMLS